jgi:hypothetical protein
MYPNMSAAELSNIILKGKGKSIKKEIYFKKIKICCCETKSWEHLIKKFFDDIMNKK